MLIKNRKTWKWFTWGKHPALEDFVWAGTQTPLFQRFTKWVDTGFARFEVDSNLRTRNCSWRFYTKGSEQEIVCGLVRNSCDSHGRSFPLLYIGTGSLKDWLGNCTMLPLALEPIWKSIEYISSARFDTLGQLNESLQLIESPAPKWRHYQQRIYNSPNKPEPVNCMETMEGEKNILRFACKQPENLPQDLLFCQRVMSMGTHHSPMAVFIGEIKEDIAVAIINSTLTPSDFVWLWSLGQ